jgi:signal transduction histidine kinase
VVNYLWLYNIVLFSVALIVTIIFAQQITKQQKQAEDKLVRNERLAVLGQLSGGIGHELRNPLGAIQSAVFFLRMTLENPDQDISETLDILDFEVSTSNRIISSLLEFARPKSPTRQKVQVNDVINMSIAKIRLDDGIEVVYQLDSELPFILADPTQIAQIVTNIGINAVQAMPDGGQLTITTQLVNSGWIAMVFTDTGVGIPKENLHQLYEPLFTTKAKGIGLGLAIIKLMVEAHGGSIEVQSEVGKGTTFTVKLPSILPEGK